MYISKIVNCVYIDWATELFLRYYHHRGCWGRWDHSEWTRIYWLWLTNLYDHPPYWWVFEAFISLNIRHLPEYIVIQFVFTTERDCSCSVLPCGYLELSLGYSLTSFSLHFLGISPDNSLLLEVPRDSQAIATNGRYGIYARCVVTTRNVQMTTYRCHCEPACSKVYINVANKAGSVQAMSILLCDIRLKEEI